jgi:hypothetical protein
MFLLSIQGPSSWRDINEQLLCHDCLSVRMLTTREPLKAFSLDLIFGSSQVRRYSYVLRLDVQGSIPGRGKIFYSTQQGSDRFWGLPSLLSNGYQGL